MTDARPPSEFELVAGLSKEKLEQALVDAANQSGMVFAEGSNPVIHIGKVVISMANKQDDKSVSISGSSLTGSSVQTGDHNTSDIRLTRVELPPLTSDFDPVKELEKLRRKLVKLNSEDSQKVKNALSDAKSELSKTEPDKNEVGGALKRALTYAKNAADFTTSAAKIAPYLKNFASWLGEEWYEILNFVGLSAGP